VPEYDIDFAAKLAQVAREVDESDPWAYDARRVTIYLSRLSAEIAMKALLERAGVTVNEIRKHRHNLPTLLKALDSCVVELKDESGNVSPASAGALIRAATIDFGIAHMPIGELIEAADERISKYPNEIRYGNVVRDFQPGILCEMPEVLCQWAKKHWGTIKVRGI